MRIGSEPNSKCTKLREDERKTERMCIAVTDGETTDTSETMKLTVQNITVEDQTQKQPAKHCFSINMETVLSLTRKIGSGLGHVLNKAKAYLRFDVVTGADSRKHRQSTQLPGHKLWLAARRKVHRISLFLKSEKSRRVYVVTGTAATVALAVFVLSLNFSLGFEAVVNGQSIGIVQSEDQCLALIDELNQDLTENFGEESKIETDVVTVPTIIQKDQYSTEEELKNNICKLSDKMLDMFVIYAGDTPLCALATQAEADAALQGFRDYYTGGNQDVSFTTEQEMYIKAEPSPVSLLRNVEQAVQLLNGSDKQNCEYTVQAGDTLWSISEKYDTTVDELMALNEGITEEIIIGDVIHVAAYVPVVNVTTTQAATYTTAIPYETEIIETDEMYTDESEIVQEGVNGESSVTANIVKVNGQEVSREIISEQVISEPVNQIKRVGIKEPPSGYGTGSFISPANGTITSRFGYRRSGYHKGLDIANSTGTPIVAADTGIVITAGWEGLFGNLVKINHQNGFISYYGHNSKIVVSVGQIVEKGQVIAYMGSTGNSTGPHCHFELYKNGVLQNPENYI